MLEAREVNTAEEVHETIEKMNKGLRNFLDSKIFVQKFSEEEGHMSFHNLFAPGGRLISRFLFAAQKRCR